MAQLKLDAFCLAIYIGYACLHGFIAVAQLKLHGSNPLSVSYPCLHGFIAVAQLKLFPNTIGSLFPCQSPRLHRRGPIEAVELARVALRTVLGVSTASSPWPN